MTPLGDDPEAVDPAEVLVPLVDEATVRIHGAGPGRPLYGSGFFVAPGWVLTCAHVACRTPWGEGARPAGGEAAESGAESGAEAAAESVEEAAAVATRPGARRARRVVVGWGDRMLLGVVEWAQPDEDDGRGSWAAPDLALVRLLDAVDHPCVWLTERTPKAYSTSRVAFFGYTEPYPEPYPEPCTPPGAGEEAGGEAPAAYESYSGMCTISGQLGGGVLKLGNEDEMPYGVSGGPVVDLARGEVVGLVKARRKGRDGGLAVGLQQLRRIPGGAKPADDLYQRVMAAHDLYHADQHGFVRGQAGTWTDAHHDIGACGGRALTAGQRTQLLGLLAQLPPPADAHGLMEIVTAVRGGPARGLPVAPRAWRDGLGLLYDLRRGNAELEAVLRYAVLAATADRAGPTDEAAERAVWLWAQDTAASVDGLNRLFRSTLVDERRARLQLRASPGVDLTPSQWRGPEALLEIIHRGWEPGRYDWRVSVLPPGGDVECVEEEYEGTELAALPDRLREPLREVFRRCDAPGRLATLQLAVPGALVGFAAETWPLGPGGGTLSADRPVVIRRTDAPEEDRQAAGERAARWRTLHQQQPHPELLDCDEGAPGELPDDASLRDRPRDTLPVLCRSASTAHEALHRLYRNGYSVALWRREPVGQETVCTDFHRGVQRTVRAARTAGRLPGLLAELRAAVGDRVPESYWSAGLSMLYDDPTRPLPGAGDPLVSP